MSDAIREALKAVFIEIWSAGYEAGLPEFEMPVFMRRSAEEAWQIMEEESPETLNEWQAALQSQTAPELDADAGKVVQGEPVGNPTETGLYCVRFTVHGGSQANAFIPFCTCHGWAKHQVDIWSPASKPKSSEWPIANMVCWSGPFTHPAESREEIQAQALDAVWDQLYDMAEERTASDPEEASGIMTAVTFIKGQAARLRASQQEGG